MRRTLVVILALLAIAFAGASTVAAQQGDENLPCTTGGHWILSPWESEPPVFDGLTFDKVTGKAVHYLSGPVDATSFAAIAAQHEDLKLSHCLEEEASQKPSIEPSPSEAVSSEPPVVTNKPSPSVEQDISPANLPDTSMAIRLWGRGMDRPLTTGDLILAMIGFGGGYLIGSLLFGWLFNRRR